MEPRERRAHKARGGGEVAGQSQRAHAAAVERERERVGKEIFRLLRREVHEVVEREHLLRKRRVVRQHARGIVVDLQTIRDGLDHDRAAFVGKEPVELRGRELRAERRADEVHCAQGLTGLRERRAAAQQSGNELKLRDILPIGDDLGVLRAADKVEPRHAEPLFVHRVVVKRKAVGDVRRADDGVMRVHHAAVAQGDGEAARSDDDLLAVGKLIVERAAHVKVSGLVRCCGTHGKPPESIFD